MSKESLIRRLSWYYPVERINAFVIFPMIALYHLSVYSIRDVFPVIYGLFVCVLILYQGQHYWKMKLYRLTGKPVDQTRTLRQFRLWKIVNECLIGAIPLVFFTWLYFEGWIINPGSVLYWIIGANVFAVLEYINYFHWQLTIDKVSDLKYVVKNRRLKNAHLGKELKDNKL